MSDCLGCDQKQDRIETAEYRLSLAEESLARALYLLDTFEAEIRELKRQIAKATR